MNAGTNWFAIVTESRKELLVHQGLEDRGFKTWYPHTTEWSGLSTRKPLVVKKPYFPRYLFVFIGPSGFSLVHRVSGVVRILRGASEMPLSIPTLVMEALFELADCTGAIYGKLASRGKFGAYRGKAGDRVKFRDGHALWGHDAEILSVDGAQIRIILDRFLGASRETVVAPAELGDLVPPDDKKQGQLSSQ